MGLTRGWRLLLMLMPALMMLALVGFSGSVLFFFAYTGVVVFPLASLAGGIVHAIQLARARRPPAAP